MPAHTTPRMLAATLAAALLLAAATSTAAARSFSTSNQNIRITWSAVEFVSAATVRCRITLEGSFHSRTIAKVERSLIGAVTRLLIDTENCTGGRGRLRSEFLPAHLSYEGFEGTLPNISSVYGLLSRLRFQIIVSGICTGDYGNSTDNITGRVNIEAGGGITNVAPVAGRNIFSRVSSSGLCPATGNANGSASAMLLGTTTRISVFLI